MSAPYVLWKDEDQDENTGESIGPAWLCDGEQTIPLWDGGWLSQEAARAEAARRNIEYREA